MRGLLDKLVRLLSSHGLACALLLLLCLLTYVGTVEQVRIGLFQAQQRYFTSWLTTYPLALDATGERALPIPLPGGLLLMTALAVNLLMGGIVRLRRDRSRIGLFVVHGGILYMLAGSLVTHVAGHDGQMTIAPGQTASRFQSYHDWELAVIDPAPDGHDLEYRVTQRQMARAANGRGQTVRAAGLPFDILLSGYAPNAEILPKGPMFEAPTPVVDGFFVNPLPKEAENERNLPALYLTLVDRESGEERREILWGASPRPLLVESAGRRFAFLLRHVTWDVPFEIQLKKFTREFHPGTETPRAFQSEVVQIRNGQATDAVIRMNEPLRSDGYVLFQSGYREDPATGRFSTILAVARNPADQWPLYACILITAGLLLHFGRTLARHLRRERARAA